MSSIRTRTVWSWVVIVALGIGAPLLAAAEDAAGTDGPSVTQEANEEDALAPDASKKAVEEPDDLDKIENLVVTVRRRPEFLQETPVAATVLGGELLERRGLDSLEDIGVYVPNLSSFSGAEHQGTFYQRGVGQRDGIPTLDPGVGIYVDDVYVARAQGSLLPIVDVDRVEVLRGPQGTLYGKNTIGGAIKVISEKPSPEPMISGSFASGNYESMNGHATVNAPLIDDLLYSRFTFDAKDSQGYARNVFEHEQSSDDENLKAVRAQFRLLPLENVTFDLAGHYTNQREDSKAGKCRVSNPGLSQAIGIFYNACNEIEHKSTYNFASERDDHYLLDTYGTSLVGNWEVGPILGLFDSFDLKTVTAWQQQDVDSGFLDPDATGMGFPFQIYQRSMNPQRQTQYSQEFNATAGIGDLLRVTTGLYGFWENTGGGNIQLVTFGAQRDQRTEIDTKSYAAYGQTSVTPFSWVELTAGLRGTWEDKGAKRTIVVNQLAPLGELPVENVSESFSQLTPMAGIAFKAPTKLIEDTPIGSSLLYFTYSQGYKSGGFSTRRDPSVAQIPSFKPEELENYEVGVKLEMFNSRLLFNTALFYSEYKNMQLDVARVNPLSPPFQPDVGTAIDNAGKAHIQGLEVEMITRLFDQLSVRASVGITDAQYDKFDDRTWDIDGGGNVTNIRTLDRSNEDFGIVPALNIDGSVEYPIDLARLGLNHMGTLTPLAHVYYQSSSNYSLTAEGFDSGKFRQSPYTLLDVRMTYDMADDRTQLSLFCNNLLATDYFDSAIDVTNGLGQGSVFYAPPRMFGGEIRYKWSNPGFMNL